MLSLHPAAEVHASEEGGACPSAAHCPTDTITPSLLGQVTSLACVPEPHVVEHAPHASCFHSKEHPDTLSHTSEATGASDVQKSGETGVVDVAPH
mmetsp:Transcript_9216/g.21675  ORF Transcript_9216/g.21675 Transcript_9216/m.21675 type:complete len:95 (-) Transcript_9216:28-312(-)